MPHGVAPGTLASTHCRRQHHTRGMCRRSPWRGAPRFGLMIDVRFRKAFPRTPLVMECGNAIRRAW